MARTTATNFTGSLQFPYATAATDLFKKEDVQTLAQAVDAHDHTTGKGVSVPISTNASLLVNGGFEIWQRGNGAFTAGGTYSADRWMLGVTAPATVSVSADTTNVDSVGNSKVAAACVVTITTGAANISQNIEDFTQLRGKTITASMRVRTSAGAPRCQIAISQNASNNTLGTSHTGDGTWQTLTVTYAVPTGTTRLELYIIFGASGTYYLDNAMLVIGSQPAGYAPLHPADEMLRCQRYYERLDKAASSGLVQAFAYSATATVFLFHYKVLKAVAPTVTFAAPANYTLASAAAAPQACTSLINNGADQASFQGGAQCASGLVAGNASFLSSAGSGGNFIIEANP